MKRFKNSITRHTSIKESVTIYKNSIKDDQAKPINQSDLIEEKLNNILVGLNQMNNKFEVLEKRFNTEFQLLKQKDENKISLSLNQN